MTSSPTVPERGDLRGFVSSALLFVLCTATAGVCFHAWQPEFQAMWGNADEWYINRFRPLSAGVWRLCVRAEAYPIVALLPCLWFWAVFCVQRVFVRRIARRINFAHSCAIVLGCATAFGALAGLLFLPML
jgi:hypothetical protein